MRSVLFLAACASERGRPTSKAIVLSLPDDSLSRLAQKATLVYEMEKFHTNNYVKVGTKRARDRRK